MHLWYNILTGGKTRPKARFLRRRYNRIVKIKPVNGAIRLYPKRKGYSMEKQPAGIFNNEPEPIKSILKRVLEELKKKSKVNQVNQD